MPFDAAAYMRGYRARQKSARLNAGLPVPDLQWPKNYYGNNISPRELMDESALPPTAMIGKQAVGAYGRCHCGCGLPSNGAIAKVLNEAGVRGMSKKIVYFRSMSCRMAWGRENESQTTSPHAPAATR